MEGFDGILKLCLYVIVAVISNIVDEMVYNELSKKMIIYSIFLIDALYIYINYIIRVIIYSINQLIFNINIFCR
jgi:hypothetical protein